MAAERRLSVDWPACKGHGLCAELVPELITLDEWGYPILADRAVTRGVQAHAQRAVASCPTLALLLVEKTIKNAPSGNGADDPITGAIKAVTGSHPVQRRTPPVTPVTSPVIPVASPPVPVAAQPAAQAGEAAPRRPAAADSPRRRARAAAAASESPRRSAAAAAAEPPRQAQPRRRPVPADDPITGAIQAVTGPNATQRRTPPTGMARHATPAYGQPALVPEAEPYEPGDSFFEGYEPRRPYAPDQPRTRREARARRK
ncbi:ferredoxin [Kineosporia rhizophila]|uniref:ferredoxin n=1 Tax=Kineosporia TaxID=49184 RepID=UPI001E5EA008|nr:MULTISPECIES: ferredoxin [Kineosporia]MCE0536963.1 ferredoxin [Kineosporia rhizophila]GLY19119.1 hypothetical protein Kisp01_61330 [Kineosporia sp. NBRC 101677]